MHLIGHTQLYINSIQVYDICQYTGQHDSNQLGATCDIQLPLLVRIQYKDGKYDKLTQVKVTEAFAVGDLVEIYSYYEGYNNVNVFTGFIRDFTQGQPLTVKCMDYQYFWNFGIFGEQNRVLIKKNKKSKRTFTSWGAQYAKITLKDLVSNLVDFVNDTIDSISTNADNITLILPMPDITLYNITFALMTPAAILHWLREKLGLCITMIGSGLFVNVAQFSNQTFVLKSGNPLDFVNDMGNITKCNIQKSYAAFSRFKVVIYYLLDNGQKSKLEIGQPNGETKEFFYYNLKYDPIKFKALAQDCYNKCKQNVFTGDVTLTLYPWVNLYDKVNYSRDYRFSERQANFIVVGKNFSATPNNGYRQVLKLAFLSNI
jgi:hypothetical protein